MGRRPSPSEALQYMPFLHTIRVVTTVSVALLSWLNKWGFDVFLMLYAGQLVFMYSLDYWAGWYFSLRQPRLIY
jgi:hypothetical protein